MTSRKLLERLCVRRRFRSRLRRRLMRQPHANATAVAHCMRCRPSAGALNLSCRSGIAAVAQAGLRDVRGGAHPSGAGTCSGPGSCLPAALGRGPGQRFVVSQGRGSVAQKRVEEHVVVSALVEERAANRPLQDEAALLSEMAGGCVLGDDHQVDAIPLLGCEQVSTSNWTASVA